MAIRPHNLVLTEISVISSSPSLARPDQAPPWPGGRPQSEGHAGVPSSTVMALGRAMIHQALGRHPWRPYIPWPSIFGRQPGIASCLLSLIGILPEKLKNQGKKVGTRQAREGVG